MALIFYSPNIQQLRGKAGGSVYCQCLYGPVLRTRAKQTKKNTPRSEEVHSFCLRTKTAYRQLTIDERESWKSFAASFPIPTNKQRTKFLDGYGCFLKLNGYRLTLGLPILTRAPNSWMPKEIEGVSLHIEREVILLEWAPAYDYRDYSLLLYLTPLLYASKGNLEPWRRQILVNVFDLTRVNVYNQWLEKFGQSIKSGARIGAWLRFIDNETTAYSTEFHISAVSQ